MIAVPFCLVAACLLAAETSPLPVPPAPAIQAPASSTAFVVARLSVIDLELGVPFDWELRAERLADGKTMTYCLHCTSSGSVAVPMQAQVTLKHIEARPGIRSVALADGTFSLRSADAEVATVSVTPRDANAATYTVVRRGVTALRATIDATQWAMADRSAPSLPSVLAMLSVDLGLDETTSQ